MTSSWNNMLSMEPAWSRCSASRTGRAYTMIISLTTEWTVHACCWVVIVTLTFVRLGKRYFLSESRTSVINKNTVMAVTAKIDSIFHGINQLPEPRPWQKLRPLISVVTWFTRAMCTIERWLTVAPLHTTVTPCLLICPNVQLLKKLVNNIKY